MPLDEEIRQKFVENGDRLSYQFLVDCYKEKFLNDEAFKAEFKKTVKMLASIKEENGSKILVLKANWNPPVRKLPDGLKSSILEALRGELEDSSASFLMDSSFAQVERPFDGRVGCPPFTVVPQIKVTSSDSENQAANSHLLDCNISSAQIEGSDFNQPVENTKSCETFVDHQITCDSKESTPDSMTSQQISNYSRHASPKRERGERFSSTENCSVASISLSTEEFNWLSMSCKCDYTAMVKCLAQKPDLANFQDFTSGYNALHWAAKLGNSAAINLLAGDYKLDVDRRSGYTPLHLAAMHGHRSAMKLLTRNYGACRNIRDNSGRKADQYIDTAFHGNSTNSAMPCCGPLKENTLNLLNNKVNAKIANFFMQNLYPAKIPIFRNFDEQLDESSAFPLMEQKSTTSAVKLCNSLPNALNLCAGKQQRIGSLRLSKRLPKVVKLPSSPLSSTKNFHTSTAEPVQFRNSCQVDKHVASKHKSTEV